MASQNKIIQMIGAVKTIYPYYSKDVSGEMVETLIRTWGALLKPYDDSTVETAFHKCLQTCKMPPTPADVIEQIKSMYKALEQSDEELWDLYVSTLRRTYDQMSRFGHTFVDDTGMSQGQQARKKVDEMWGALPDKIKTYLRSKGELMRNAQAWGASVDFVNYEKPRFMKAMPVMEKRHEYNALLLETGKNQLKLTGH